MPWIRHAILVRMVNSMANYSNAQAAEMPLDIPGRRRHHGRGKGARRMQTPKALFLRRVRHAGRLAHQHRARGRGDPEAARPFARLARLRRRLARRISAGDGGNPQRADSRSASSTCCTGATSKASCRASRSPACPEDTMRHLNLAWHRLDAWPDSAPGLARLKKQVPDRAGVERQHLADGRSRAPQRLSRGTRSSAPRSPATSSRSRGSISPPARRSICRPAIA